ncbi:hypothetical protein C2E23DRAFT_869967 [Lenzites betulinus]|nr:hypothetical protein C2E23DRAFT_869967 [Lenzites betulinus]
MGGSSSFAIDVINFYTLEQTAVVPMPSNCETHAEALVLGRYLGTVPLQPSLAISLKTLKLLWCIRLFKASFSIESFAKLMCHYYSIPYRCTYHSALSDAFNIYLNINQEVGCGVSRALGRDQPNWHVLNSCPPCGYKVCDECVYEGSDYFLPRSFVDKYANEVHSRPALPATVNDDNNNNNNNDGGEDGADGAAARSRSSASEEGDPTNGSAVISNCTKNWKAAAEEKKRVFGIFDETGVFASACWHGLILWIANMVRSSELGKYPLSMVSKMLEVLDTPTLGGFDISCTFEGTIKSSSLGPAFQRSGSRICINAFHGYSHNYQCQLCNHPNIFPGIGLEDLEVIECIFSTSNHLASIVRYASAYCRRVLIDAFYCHWDNEKYQNLRVMLLNNYCQALEIIHGSTPELANALASLELTVDDLKSYRQDELKYFSQLGEELPEDLHAIAYVEMLQEINGLSAELDNTEDQFLASVPADYVPTGPSLAFLPPHASATCRAETRHRYLKDRHKALRLEVTALEVKMGIVNTWQPGDLEYIKVKEYIATRKYQHALGHLQRLVVQRLFKLHRLNLAQTAYRVRMHIAKHLQTRCKAIRTAVKNYNAAAATLNPPRPPLDWSHVSHMRFMEEFDLLCNMHGDLLDKPWKQPAVRETMHIAHCIEHAQEEIQRLNIEVCRLHTAICDEHELFDIVLDDLALRADIWYDPLLEHAQQRRHVNARVLAYIDKIYSLESLSESHYKFQDFSLDEDYVNDIGVVGAVNRELEVRLGSRTGRGDTFELKERGPGILALVDVLDRFLRDYPNDVLLLKWADDACRAAELVYSDAKQLVSYLRTE